ncbi:MAG TPA: hypothetical protein DHN33_04975, partial [Eubacteriaceae bacterium]|nr:hypothetical protein [Eubacteriaceae bacterium]
MSNLEKNYMEKTREETIEDLKSNEQKGLSEQQAKNRLREYGRNQFAQKSGVSPWA